MAWRIFTISPPGLVSKGAMVERGSFTDGRVIPVISSRQYNSIPIQFSIDKIELYKKWQKGQDVMIDAVEVKERRFFFKTFKTADIIDTAIIVVVRTRRDKNEIVILATQEGSVISGRELLGIIDKDVVFRTIYSDPFFRKNYSAPYYYMWDGQELLTLTQGDKRIAIDLF